MKTPIALCMVLLLTGCASPSPRHAASPFSDVFLRAGADFSSGTNLYVVVDSRPAGGTEAMNRLVVTNAQAILREAKRKAGRFDEVIFFVRDRPESETGCAATLTVTELQQIADDPDEGKRVLFSQAWPVLSLPVERPTPGQRPATEPPE